VVGENYAIRRHQLLPIGPDLYGGRAGVGAFLAAAAVAHRDERLAELALHCVRPIVVAQPGPVTGGIGGALTGQASALYGAAVVAHLLDDAALERQVISAGMALPPNPSSTTTGWSPVEGLQSGPSLGGWDVASGPLGAALALGVVARLLDSHPLAVLATKLAPRDGIDKHLLPEGAGGQEEEAAMGRADTGLAHGLLGAALAWQRLAEVLDPPGTTEYIEACVAAAATQLGQENRFGDTRWCHGAAGIGLAIVALAPRCSSPGWRGHLERALDACRQMTEQAESTPGSTSPLDASVCCGLGGAVELLTVAGHPGEARRAAALLVAPEGDDWPIGKGFGAAPLMLGFHRGVAGLGYTLLRAAGQSLPSILTWSCL
jgi:lantibiotic modifying enzyme